MGAPARTLTIAITEISLAPTKTAQMLYKFNMLYTTEYQKKTFILYKNSVKRNFHVEKLSFFKTCFEILA